MSHDARQAPRSAAKLISALPEPAVLLIGLIVFAAFRAYCYGILGIRARTDVLLYFWQFEDLALLHHDLLRSIWYLHSQPPLMNFLLGVILKLCSGSLQAAGVCLEVIFTLAAAGMFICTVKLSQAVIKRSTWVLVIALALAVHPSIIFYERTFLYPLPSAALLSILIYSFYTALKKNSSFLAFCVCPFLLASLSLLWSLFHPCLVPALELLGYLSFQRLGLVCKKKHLPAAVFFIILAFFPLVKNFILFDVAATSSWFGMNLLGTVDNPVTDPNCTFCLRSFADLNTAQYAELAGANPFPYEHPSLTALTKNNSPHYTNYNYWAYILLAKESCSSAIASITKYPLSWLGSRILTFINSNSKAAWEMACEPANFNRIPGVLLSLSRLELFGISFLFLYNFSCCVFLSMESARIAKVLRTPYHFTVLLVSAFFFYIQITSHAFNGFEQERMRFAIEPILLSLGTFIIIRRARGLIARYAERRGPPLER